MSQSSQASNSLTEERICELLRPMQQENATIEYIRQYKSVKDFSQKLQALETLLSNVYSSITSLEREIVKQSKH